MRTNYQQIDAIDLFCGAGGLTKGLSNSKINVRAGVDNDVNCKFPYTTNNNAKFLLKSVKDINACELAEYYKKGNLKLLAGCAPCQTFSTYNSKADTTDSRWWLLLEFARLVNELNPEFVTMENVPGLVKQQVFDDFVNNLNTRGYFVNFGIVDCSEYGLPQQRKRLVLLASKFKEIKLLSNKDFDAKQTTVYDAIGHLPPLKHNDCNDNDILHQTAKLSQLNLKRIRASRPGGSWKDWAEELVADCHKRKSGKTYAGVYGRMCWDKPAPTMTTQFYGFGNGRFGHPEQDRAISLREGAIFQGFPEDYKFIDKDNPVKKTVIGRLIGNAVPVTLGEVIGQSFMQHIKEYNDEKKKKALTRKTGKNHQRISKRKKTI